MAWHARAIARVATRVRLNNLGHVSGCQGNHPRLHPKSQSQCWLKDMIKYNRRAYSSPRIMAQIFIINLA